MTVFNLVKRDGDYYVVGLYDEWGDDEDMLLVVRHDAGDADTVHENNKNMHRALYDLYQVCDELVEGDEFAIDGVVVYRCEDVHVNPVQPVPVPHVSMKKWGWDTELVKAIELIAETPTTSETPGAVWDETFDMMISFARGIVGRERLREKGVVDE